MKKIIISGEIGWDVYPGDIRRQIAEAGGDDLSVEISSPGGFVYFGLEIFNLIKNAPGKKTTRLMGLAASMASYIALAGDYIEAEDNAVYMIHNVWGAAVGDYRDMEKEAELLDGLTGLLAKKYAERTGKSEKEIRKMMDDETWLFGDEMVAAGFVDAIIITDKPKDRAASIAEARAKFAVCSEHIKDLETPEDRKAVASLLGIKNQSHTPAPNAGKNNQEDESMTLAEYLAQNPAAKIEYNDAISAATAAGEKSGREAVEKRVESASVFLAAESTYPDPIKNLAVKTMKGESTVDSLLAAAAAYDAMSEQTKSATAKIESGEQGGHGQGDPRLSTDGVIRNEADLAAAIAKAKGGK